MVNNDTNTKRPDLSRDNETPNQTLITLLEKGSIQSVQEFLGNNSEIDLSDPQLVKAVKLYCVNRISLGYYNQAKDLLKLIPIPEFSLDTRQFEAGLRGENGKIGLTTVLTEHNFKKEFIGDPEIVVAAQSAVIRALSSGASEAAQSTMREFQIPDERINDSDIQDASHKGIKTAFTNALYDISHDHHSIVSFEDYKKRFEKFLSAKDVDAIALETSIDSIGSGKSTSIFDALKYFNISPDTLRSPDFQPTVKTKILDVIGSGAIVSDTIINGLVDGPDDFKNSAEFNEAAKNGFIVKLKKDTDSALAFSRRYLGLDNQGMIDLVLDIIKDELPAVEARLPKIIEVAKRSLEGVRGLLKYSGNFEKLYSMMDQNVFLGQACEANPRFGPRLLFTYGDFGPAAQANITEAFIAKKVVSVETHGSVLTQNEHRQGVETVLTNFKRNNEIVAAAADLGVDTAAWLGTHEPTSFVLRSSEESKFNSDKIKQPFGDLKQRLQNYGDKLRQIINGKLSGTKEFFNKKVLNHEKISQASDDLKKMEESLATTNLELKNANSNPDQNKLEIEKLERRRQGLEKSIIQSRASIADMEKTPSATIKEILNSYLIAIDRLLSKVDEIIIKIKSNDESGVPSKALQDELSRLVTQIKSRFDVLRDRATQYAQDDSNIEQILKTAEGEMADDFGHIEEEVAVILDITKDKKSIKGEDLVGHEMSAEVWSRDPDVDLYQGNYSPCCVSIEGKIHVPNSPIADYFTDLGMQVVNLKDKNTGDPVAAAWLWLGVNPKTKETALVVDNIEADTRYSLNFQQQLADQLLPYLQAMAKRINVNKLVLGVANNDIPTDEVLGSLPENRGVFKKIGGYNSTEEYYLEAREEETRVVWSK